LYVNLHVLKESAAPNKYILRFNVKG